MADAPEVVPGSLRPDSIPAISPAPIAQASRDERSPSPPYHQAPESSQIRNVSGEKEIREPDRTASDEKEFLKFNESTIKYPINSKAPREPDRTTPMYAAEEQDRNTPKYPVEDVSIPRQEITGPDDFAGCRGIDSGGPEELSPTEQRRANTEDGEEWHNSLWGCCSEGSRSLCCEVSFMPCILAGRRYLRVKNTKPNEMTSTNIYCLGCFVFTIPLIPFWWVLGMSTRREIRYRYGLRGSNKEDCMASCFCAWCALVQEEKELLWREERRVGSGLDNGYRRRGEQMVYSPA